MLRVVFYKKLLIPHLEVNRSLTIVITFQVIVLPVYGATSVDLNARNALILGPPPRFRAQVLHNLAEHPKVPLLTVNFQLKSTTSFVNAIILNS